jgi:hypothetical protein
MTTEQKPSHTAGVGNDDLMDRIDTVTADTSRDDDIEPGSMEARMRMLLPGHTFFQVETGIPEPIQRLLDGIGAELEGAPKVRVLSAVWSTPSGVWMFKVQECARTTDSFHMKIDGPDTEMERQHLTQDQVIDLLAAVGAINPT